MNQELPPNALQDQLANLSESEKRDLLARLLEKKKAQQQKAQQRFPLSHAQKRLWFMDQLNPNQSSYHIPAALEIEGNLNVEQLNQAINQVIERHESLRSRFPSEQGEPFTVIDNPKPIALTPEPIPTTSPTESTTAVVETALQELVNTPFSLANGPLIRIKLFKAEERRYFLLLCLHHIIADYWSLRLFVKEISILYTQNTITPLVLPTLPIQYVDYAHWQTNQTHKLEHQLNYWKKQLESLPPTLPLPTDFTRPKHQSTQGAKAHFRLNESTSERLQAIAKEQQVSLFVTLLAVFQTLLFRYSGQEDILIGTTISNREHKDTQNLIGLFVNNLVFRGNLSSTLPFIELLQQTKNTVLDAFAHQDLPFEQLVDQLKLERHLDRHPLFQVLFVLHNTPEPEIQLPDIRLKGIETDSLTTRFDLALDMVETKGPSNQTLLQGTLEYSTDLFKPETINQLLEQFQALLASIGTQPTLSLNSYPWHRTEDTNTLLKGPKRPYNDIVKQLEAEASANPQSVAIQFQGLAITYKELWQMSNNAMDHLSQLQPDPQQALALCLPRSVELVVAIVSCLRLGIPFIPLDIRQPAERLQAMLDDANPQLAIISSTESPSALTLNCPVVQINQLPEVNADHIASPTAIDNLAYIIFTSGSTGRPKGVPITRKSLSNFIASMAHDLKTPGQTMRLLAATTIGFDISLLELLLPLYAGGTLVLADENESKDGVAQRQLLADHDITHFQATPAGWRLLIEHGWPGSSDLIMMSGGEALNKELAQQLLQRGKKLWNLYGPTETTIWSAALPITKECLASCESNVPVGNPIANTWLQVVNESGQPLPPGVSGELLIGGDGLSPGYLGREALTKEKFILYNPVEPTLPASEEAHQFAYRTGDRVRLNHNGLLEFLGRVDHQIKLRGYRIEPGEIESVIQQNEHVALSVVNLWQQHTQTQTQTSDYENAQLVAWIQLHPHIEKDTHCEIKQQLIEQLKQQLPAYMQPSSLCIVEQWPLNTNGKIDRKKLPTPTFGSVANDSAHTSIIPLQGELQHALAEIWNELLPGTVQSACDDFFALGGHSLLAARMLAHIHSELGVEISLRTLFLNSELRKLANQIEIASHSNQAQSELADLLALPRNNDTKLLLSSAQQRQWILAQLEPDSPFYNIPIAIEVEDNLDTAFLQQAIDLICSRHENLRTVYPSQNGEPTLSIQSQIAVPVIEHDLSESDTQLADKNSIALLMQTAQQPFQLGTGPLLRVCVIRLPENRFRLMLVIHHILADAWSLQTLMSELTQVYFWLCNGESHPLNRLPKLELQYADYATWQRKQNQQHHYLYWVEQLTNAPTLLDVPTDFKRPQSQSFSGESITLRIPSAQYQALNHLAQQQQSSLFMVMMALFQWLLHRYSEMNDIVVGTPVGHRPDSRLNNTIGLFANTLAIRTQIESSDTFEALLARVKHTVLDAFEHQQTPFDQIIDGLNIARNWSHAPLVQVMLSWQAARNTTPNTDAPWKPLPLNYQQSKFDISLNLVEENNAIIGRLEYRSDLFRQETMEAMAEAFTTLAETVSQNHSTPLSRINLCSKSQRHKIDCWNSQEAIAEYWLNIKEQNGGKNSEIHKIPDHCTTLIEPFQQQAKATPQACALIDNERQWTYQELDQLSNALAHRCLELGAEPESPIAICLNRDVRLIVAVLAALKSGAGYVPLDPNYPIHRLTQIVDNAQPTIVIGAQDLPNDVFAHHNISRFNINDLNFSKPAANAGFNTPVTTAAQPDTTAYLIYTSGSTGVPKGVTIEHQQALAMIQWAARSYHPKQLKAVLASTSICFDLSVFEIFAPLSIGGCVALVDSVLELWESPACNQISLINTVPTAATELLRINNLPLSVNTVNLAGEALPAALVRKLYQQPNVEAVFNLYGPSEDTTYSTGVLLPKNQPDNEAVSIGRPIHNTQAHVMDSNGIPVPQGMCGELYLSGAGVARGYWRQRDLTAQRFSGNPVCYRTGDRVRQRYDGQLEYLGRFDQQIKVQGFRIETGDIENALEQHNGIAQAAVCAISLSDNESHKSLAAFVVCNESHGAINKINSELRQHLAERLPHYMVPSRFEVLSALPRLPNGKVDRGKLPSLLNNHKQEEEQLFDAAQEDVSPILLSIWQHILNRSDIPPNAHFFELGGDSILAIQMVSRAREQGISLQPKDLFQYPTLAGLSAKAQQQTLTSIDQTPLTGPVALMPAQSWFFEQSLQQPQHWNQSLLLNVKKPLNTELLKQAIEHLAQRHDVLRAQYTQESARWHQIFLSKLPSNATILDVVNEEVNHPSEFINNYAGAAQSAFQLSNAPLWKVIYFDLTASAKSPAEPEKAPVRRLLIISHHLIIDGVSWRILLQDLWQTYEQLESAQKVTLAPRTHNASHWVSALEQHLPQFLNELPFWEEQIQPRATFLPQDMPHGENRMANNETQSASLTQEHTLRLIKNLAQQTNIKSDELIFAALCQALFQWSQQPALSFIMEGHGRTHTELDIDLSHTLGWFTTLYPLTVIQPENGNNDTLIKQVKSRLRSVPNQGLGYGVLRWLAKEKHLKETEHAPPIRFNYLGQSDNLFNDNPLFAPARESTGKARSPEGLRDVLFDINALISEGCLRIHWSYSGAQYHATTINSLLQECINNLESLLNHCLNTQHDGHLVPEDFPDMDISGDELDDLLDNI